jgi:hypothetical protein
MNTTLIEGATAKAWHGADIVVPYGRPTDDYGLPRARFGVSTSRLNPEDIPATGGSP